MTGQEWEHGAVGGGGALKKEWEHDSGSIKKYGSDKW